MILEKINLIYNATVLNLNNNFVVLYDLLGFSAKYNSSSI